MVQIHVSSKTKKRLDNAKEFYIKEKAIHETLEHRVSYNVILNQLLDEVGF